MRRVKTAVVGTGFMGKVHSEAIRRLGFVDIAAVAASSEAKAREFADYIGVEKSTGNLDTILNDREIEAVHLCTPNSLHHPDSKATIAAGKAVLCEKPLAMSVAEAEDMTKA